MAPRRAGNPAVVRKGGWSPEEDEVLLQHVQEHGTHDWSSIQAKGLLNRSGKSCRLRWVNKLQPGLKRGKFSPEEERVVLDMQAEFGNKWAQIAKRLPGRTDNDVKNFWSTRQKRLARQVLLEAPPRRRAITQGSRGTSSALSHGLRALQLQEPSSAMITLQAVQEPLEEVPCIDAPLPEVLCLPGPVDAAMEPGPGADVAGTSSEPSHALDAQQEPSSASITFQASTTHDAGQSSNQEPDEASHGVPPAAVDPAVETEPGSPSTDPFFGSCTENQFPRVQTDLASLHYAAFVEPLAAGPEAPLSFGMDIFGDKIAPYDVKPGVIPDDPFSCLENYFAAAQRRCTPQTHFDDLSPEDLAFFDQPIDQVQHGVSRKN